ncbi:MAG TPA: DUF6036 family nucleotidyltransferase [Spirochaetia bacterium]|nr:DUF6036 family nucleotidyltransferase [Spirochaetia bacterium]
MGPMDRNLIVEKLRRLDEECELLEFRMSLVLSGGAAMVLGYHCPRVTYDIDTLSKVPHSLLDKYGIDITTKDFLNLPDEYTERIIEQKLGFHNLRVYILNPIDLILSKIGRGSGKDIDDCCYLIKSNKVNVAELITVYEDWKQDYIGSERRLEGTFAHILGRCGIDYEKTEKGF